MNFNKPPFTLCLLAFATSALIHAQATRTWVSGVGDDANPCSRTAPCKTFAGAISKTSAGGEIDALDPAGFGALTITKAITVDGGGSQVSSVLVNAGNGITVSAGATDVVTIRNISFQGLNAGVNGVRFLTGKALHVEHCTIQQFTQHGIDIEPTTAGAQAFVTDTISQDNGGDGLYAAGPSSLVQVTVDNSRFNNNTNGLRALDYSRFSIRNSAASGNSVAGFNASPSTGSAVISMANSTASNNPIGLQSGGGTATANIRISGVSLFINTSGIAVGSNGTVTSFGNNYNSGSGTPNATIVPQ